MLKDKFITVAVTLLIVAIAVLGYLFFDSAKEIYYSRTGNKDASLNNVTVPAGTQLPLVEPGQDNLPVTTNPQGGPIPIDSGTNRGGEAGNDKKEPASIPGISTDPASWKAYVNNKYGYSFKYPANFDFRECTSESPCKFGQVLEKDGGDLAYIAAQTQQRGWPYVTVAHYNNDSFTLPKDQKLIDWAKAKFQGENVPQDYNYTIKAAKGDAKKAIRISFPQTPQAHAREEIYFALGNNIFQIQLVDTNKSESWSFYNPWLDSFILE